MLLKINGVEIASYPSSFSVTVMDLDDAESTTRTADGTLSRDRIAIKRQIEMSWPALTWESVSAVLQAMGDEFFDFEYPDPATGQQEVKTMYVGNRQTPFAINKGGTYWWSGLQLTLTEQ